MDGPRVDPVDLDELRLLGLSRIPRCSGCGRLLALQEARATGRGPIVRFPPVPLACTYQVCKPLVERVARMCGE